MSAADLPEKLYFHVDLDAFYASVEQRDNPELRGLPVIVGGDRSGRGVVSACSYEARVFGVHSAMPVAEACRLCSEAVVLPVRMQRYQEVSAKIMALLETHTPVLQQISIDEAFLDMSGTEKLLGPAYDQAVRLKRIIRTEFGLNASIGIANSRYVAKMASDFRKPDGLHEVRPGCEMDFVAQLDLKDIWGLGKKTRVRLNQLGIHTVEELRKLNEHELRGFLGESSGSYLYLACRGIDPGIFSGKSSRHSISTETTFDRDIHDTATLETVLLELCEQVMYRVYKADAYSQTATIKVRTEDFKTVSRQRTLKHCIETVDELYGVSRNLLHEVLGGVPIRLIGVGVVSTGNQSRQAQSELFTDNSAFDHKKRAVEAAVWGLRDKLGVQMHKARIIREQNDHGENT